MCFVEGVFSNSWHFNQLFEPVVFRFGILTRVPLMFVYVCICMMFYVCSLFTWDDESTILLASNSLADDQVGMQGDDPKVPLVALGI